jgi:FlaA1/EpsC-like NDP-sugar epimerase
MGEPIKIADMARDLIRMMGKRPDSEVPILYTGLRPGEKLYEELQLENENIEVITEDFFKLVRFSQPELSFMAKVDQLLKEALSRDQDSVRAQLFNMVHSYEVIRSDNSLENLITASSSYPSFPMNQRH